VGTNLVALVAVALMAASSVWAAHGVPVPPLVFSFPVQQPNPKEAAARLAYRDVSKAQDSISRAVQDNRRRFESSSEWQDAVAEEHTARTTLDRAKADTMARLRSDTRYKSAEIELWKVQQSFEAAQSNPRPNARQLADLAGELLRKRSALSEMESDLFAKDETLKAARYSLIDAHAKLADLQEQFQASIPKDPKWRAAHAQLEQARTRLASVGK